MAGFTASPTDAAHRRGTYWGTRTNISNYELAGALNCPHDQTLELASVATRLKRLPDETKKRLINWGYAVSDAAVRKHCAHLVKADAPPQFPFGAEGVGAAT